MIFDAENLYSKITSAEDEFKFEFTVFNKKGNQYPLIRHKYYDKSLE